MQAHGISVTPARTQIFELNLNLKNTLMYKPQWTTCCRPHATAYLFSVLYSHLAIGTAQIRIATKSRETFRSGPMALLRERVRIAEQRLHGLPIPHFFLALSCWLIGGEVSVVAFSTRSRLTSPSVSRMSRSQRLRMSSDPLSLVGLVPCIFLPL
jgi:hypothetical protein